MKFYTSYFLVFSGLSHFICCGIPFVLGASTIITNLAFYSTLNPYFELFEAVEGYLFTITSIFLTLPFAIETASSCFVIFLAVFSLSEYFLLS